MNHKLLDLPGFGGVPVNQIGNPQRGQDCHGILSHFAASILGPRLHNKLQYDSVVLEALRWLWMVFVVLNLFPGDSGGVDEVPLKILVRDAAVFFQKLGDYLRKIFVGLSDCWIELKQFHSQIIPLAAEMSLYQFKTHRRRTNMSLSDPMQANGGN